jgi:hypothetical protein
MLALEILISYRSLVSLYISTEIVKAAQQDLPVSSTRANGRRDGFVPGYWRQLTPTRFGIEVVRGGNPFCATVVLSSKDRDKRIESKGSTITSGAPVLVFSEEFVQGCSKRF